MFTVDEFGKKVWVWGSVSYSALQGQVEILRVGRWSIHRRRVAKRPSGKWTNYVVYFDDPTVSGKGCWHIGASDEAFANNGDYRALRRASPETMKWLVAVLLRGERDFPHPCPDGFPAPERRPPVCRKKAEREAARRQAALDKGLELFQGAIELVDGAGAPVPGDRLVRLLKERLRVTGDQARDILAVGREAGAFVMAPTGLRLSAMGDQEIMDTVKITGLSNRLRFVGEEIMKGAN